MSYLFDAWCRDPRPLLFGEYLDELYRSWDTWTPASPHGQELAELYRECHRRIRAGEHFAVCYVGLDAPGTASPRLIPLLSQLLRRSIEKRHREHNHVAYLGHGDFMLLVEVGDLVALCSEVCDVFDTKVAAEDEPLPTVSIGVITNQSRNIVHFAQATELAIEMKRYADSVPGSVFVVDRRQETAEPPTNVNA